MSSKDVKSEAEDVDYNVRKRPSRSTAGNRYARLLQGELEKLKDDFYQETYGGFVEEDNDNDFDGETLEDDDVLDSDFNTSDEAQGDDEGAGGDSDQEATERRKKKTRRVLTRAYKEPKKSKDTSQAKKPKIMGQASSGVPDEGSSQASEIQLRQSTKDRRDLMAVPSTSKSTVASRSKRKVQTMTQEERLIEAEKMEVINKESLEKFLKLEEEKKEKRHVKKLDKGPQIRWKSFGTSVPNESTLERNRPKVTCNVVIFPDSKTLAENFPNERCFPVSAEASRKICPITRQPAKFFDPLTQQPYSSLSAFKVLRQIYKLKLSILHSTRSNDCFNR